MEHITKISITSAKILMSKLVSFYEEVCSIPSHEQTPNLELFTCLRALEELRALGNLECDLPDDNWTILPYFPTW
jgi:hypothetical protein